MARAVGETSRGGAGGANCSGATVMVAVSRCDSPASSENTRMYSTGRRMACCGAGVVAGPSGAGVLCEQFGIGVSGLGPVRRHTGHRSRCRARSPGLPRGGRSGHRGADGLGEWVEVHEVPR